MHSVCIMHTATNTHGSRQDVACGTRSVRAVGYGGAEAGGGGVGVGREGEGRRRGDLRWMGRILDALRVVGTNIIF